MYFSFYSTVTESISCTFENGICGYQIISGDMSSAAWSLISGSSYQAPITDRSNNRTSGDIHFLSLNNEFKISFQMRKTLLKLFIRALF